MSNEWYTPAKYIEAARLVMGSIDLDPASCEMANQIVRATTYYTKEQNGLMQHWYGRVWLNPPYGKLGNNKSGIEPWVKRLVWEYTHGDVQESVLLTTADTDAGWFGYLWDYFICFPLQRIYFRCPGGKIDSQINGNVFVYLGPNEASFTEVFSRFGRIVKAIDKQSERPHNLELWRDGCET